MSERFPSVLTCFPDLRLKSHSCKQDWQILKRIALDKISNAHSLSLTLGLYVSGAKRSAIPRSLACAKNYIQNVDFLDNPRKPWRHELYTVTYTYIDSLNPSLYLQNSIDEVCSKFGREPDKHVKNLKTKI